MSNSTSITSSIINLSPKQEETVETIAKLTAKLSYPPTLDEIAASMGITKGTLQYHMTALKKKEIISWKPGSARSVQITDAHYAQKFNSNSTHSSSKKDSSNSSEFTVKSEKTRVPVLGQIAAGQPLDVCEQSSDFLELDSYFPEGCYALRVKGESMIDALICNDDLVLIEPRQSATDGEIVVALLENEAATLKRFYKEDNGSIRLQPENPLMDPIFVPKEQDLKIQGIVKGVIRKV